MKLRNKILLTVSLFSMMIVIYLLWSTIPDIAEYTDDAYLFQKPQEGHVWKDWVLEARDMFWKALIGLILQICFFFSVAFWSFSEATEKRTKSRSKPETKNGT